MLVAGASPALCCRLAPTRWPSRYFNQMLAVCCASWNIRKILESLQNCSIMIAVATPKQIREVMKVDGLTNDEVKSHLQVTNHSLPLCNFFVNNSHFEMLSTYYLVLRLIWIMLMFRNTACTTRGALALLQQAIRLCWWAISGLIRSKAARSPGPLKAPFSSLFQGWPSRHSPAATVPRKMTGR